MKLKYKFYLIISATIALAACSSQKKVTHDFPPTMSDPIKAEYITIFEKGRVLYDLNCAKCHTTYVKKREVIPDFTTDQLSNYELRFANTQHENNLTEAKLTEDELVKIITFLKYKKKNPVKK